MEEWISRDALMWVSLGSGIALLIGAIAVPWIVINLPRDSFSNPRRPRWLDQEPLAIRLPVRLVKNLLACVLIVLGIAMLVLPGQGIFAIVLGVLLADIPGKLKLQQRIVGRQNVMNSLNWLRGKFRRPPLERPSIQTAA
jgi:hypothetical protein